VIDCLIALGYSRWASIGDLIVKPEEQLVEQSGITVPLTAIESELLSYLIRQGGRTATYEELYENVWRSDPDLEYLDTIQGTVNRLQEKLGEDPQNPRYIQPVRGVGYRAIDRA
jgi:DNA-binding response OmpR family regulator